MTSPRALHREVVGAGPRIVLAHGFTQTGRSWRHVAADLARDHEVVVVDAPGHGGSAAVRVDMADGAALLGEAGGRAAYIGYSMGGRLALHLALARPQLVPALVLLGATAGLDDPAERVARHAADEALATELERDGLGPFIDRWLAGPLFAGLTPEQADREDRVRNDPAGLAASLRLAGTGAQASLWGRLGELTMPVLVVAGERDAKFTAVGRRLAEAIGASASFATIPGAAHAAHLEQPAAFVAALRSWPPFSCWR